MLSKCLKDKRQRMSTVQDQLRDIDSSQVEFGSEDDDHHFFILDIESTE